MGLLDPPAPPSNRQEELNEIFVDFLQSRNVYFQANENTEMNYPVIVYEIDDQDVIYADNTAHRRIDAYQVTAIDRDPSVPVRKKIEGMSYCSFSRAYARDGLNHWVYKLYF